MAGRRIPQVLVGVALMSMLGSSAFAQSANKVGMSQGAYWTAQVSGLAAVTTQETVFARYGLSRQFVLRRALWGSADVFGPWLLRKVTRGLRRDVANALAGNLTGFYAPQVGFNVYAFVRFGK